MKLKGKLIMSAAALAACAATLTSTTYAWYTANTTVDAKGITGTTADTGSSSIQIAKEKDENKKWSSLVNLELSDITNYNKLTPLQYNNDSTFTDLKGALSTDGYLYFTLYFRTAKTSENVPLYLKTFTATNTAAKLTDFDNMVYDSEVASNWEKGMDSNAPKYSVDAVRCLGLVMESTTMKDLEKKSYQVTESETLMDETTTTASADALKYYNALIASGSQLSKTGNTKLVDVTEANSTSGTALKVGDLDKDGGVTTIKFKVYLDGWDKYCFDACKGQTFNFTVSFTSDDKLALKY